MDAKKLPIKLKVNLENGVKYGKFILRKAYENLIPNEVVWRSKAPLEHGFSLNTFENKITNEYFEEKKKLHLEKDDVILTSKEQLAYYELFRNHFGKPSKV